MSNPWINFEMPGVPGPVLVRLRAYIAEQHYCEKLQSILIKGIESQEGLWFVGS